MTPPIDLSALVDLCGQPFALINDRREVVLINQAFENAYGVSRSDAVGRACYDLIAGPGRPLPCGGNGSNCPFGTAFRGETSNSGEGPQLVMAIVMAASTWLRWQRIPCAPTAATSMSAS